MKVDQLRIGGFSGLDTESMIEQLMRAQRKPLDKLKQQKQILEWKREDYRTINSLLLELRTAVESIRYQSSFQRKAGTSSNENLVKVVSASNSAVNGVHQVKVTQLASAASLTSGKIENVDYKVDGSIHSTFKINDIEITLSEGDSISDIVKKINAVKDQTNVQVNFDEVNGRLFFMSTKTGKDSKIEITGMDNDLMKALALSSEDESGDIKKEGKQAIIEYNGTQLEFESNNITVNGITLQLKGMDANTTVNITVVNDVQGIYDSIVNFINKYNEVISKINSKLSEDKKRDIQPLTDEDREKMTEKQIELWEKNARSGLLRHDSMIESALGQFRLDFSSDVVIDGQKLSMFSIGLKTGDYTSKGKIIIDENKLKEVLTNDPDKVMNLFTHYSTSSDNSMKYKENGIIERIYQSANRAIKQLTEKAGSVTLASDTSLLSNEIKSIDRKISDFEDRLVKIEERYWKQFTAMEKAISTANAQSSWLYSQFSY